ncbi:type I-E CRISPR-associated protein Cse1/CasA [Corynebacterium sanguinis]|uniref:type I-E CRISPR-associated protein Cse1/CasA n=1 Tax=Corynebacterium sanguinis TaxID=2594913 RepID=UPI0021AE9271|nr:type I-E CRISPR-associated protein Cse1/CasA [Corynebacterium sanguinis]MCT2287690.1 type I-E CRISPR-associated protein Cse1/CasA [Corynebacterium sanguinis]
MGTATFNLIDDPWIIVHDLDGETHTAGIRSLFDGSINAAAIVGDSPTQDYSVLRVLLAIFWRAHHAALAPSLQSRQARDEFKWSRWFADKKKRLAAEARDDEVLDYLDNHHDRFNLFDPEAPFMQVAGLDTTKQTRLSISRIVPEAEHDYFTMRTGEGRKALSFAEAARWLVHTQAYDYSGIKSGAIGDSRVKGGRGYPIGTGWTGMTGGTVVMRETLLETLLFNSTPAAIYAGNSDADLASWERTPDTASERADVFPKGPADLATWQSRRVRLFEEEGLVTAVLVSNGDQIPEAGKNILGDPMTPYRFSANKSKKGEPPVYYARPYDLNRTMWRSLDPLIATESDSGFDGKNRAPKRPDTLENLGTLTWQGVLEREILDLRIVSMEYGPQASSVGTIVSANVHLPVVFFEDDDLAKEARLTARTAADATMNAAISMGWFAGQLAVAAGGEYVFGSDAADRFLAALEPRFNQWLATVNWDNLEDAGETWQREVVSQARSLADELVAGAGPKALAGRVVPPRNEGDNPTVISAGGLRDALARRLRKDLPLAHPPQTPEQKESAQ